MTTTQVEIVHNVTQVEIIDQGTGNVEVLTQSPIIVDVAAVGTQGSPGATGPTGPTGPANQLAIGTVNISPSMADAEITGVYPNQKLDLTIPQGEVGPRGEPGPAGSLNQLWLNKNADFSNWASTYPDGSYLSGSPAPTKDTVITRSGQSVRFAVASTDTSSGLGILANMTPLPSNMEYIVIEADVYLVSGNFSGAGIRLDWDGLTPSTVNRVLLDFHKEMPNPETGKWHRFSKIVRRPLTTTGGTFNQYNAWLFANHSLLSPPTTKTIIFDTVGFRTPEHNEIATLRAREINLVTNGGAQFSSNHNFSEFTYRPLEKPTNLYGSGSNGSLEFASGAHRRSDELINIDPERTYQLSFWARQSTPGATSLFYSYLYSYDVDALPIETTMVNRQVGTNIVTLASDLVAGQTTITTSTAPTGWHNGATAHMRTIAFYNYTDSLGYTYPIGSYTRNIKYDSTNGGYTNGGISGTTITLATAHTGATIPAGTSIGNHQSGGYGYTPLNGVTVPDTWTKYTGLTGGVMTPGVNYIGTAVNGAQPFAVGTAYVSIGFVGTSDNAGRLQLNQISLIDITDTRDKAPLNSPAFTGTPTGITKTHVGLANVDNTADTAKPVSTAQQTALNLKAPLASPAFTGTPTGITKTHVGLANVDNTADTAKPVSTAQQTALDLKMTKLASIGSGNTSVKRAYDILDMAANGAALVGSLVIETSLTFGNYMTSLHITGFNYLSSNGVLDLWVDFYAYSTGPTYPNASVTNLGQIKPSAVRLMRKTSDNTVVIVIDPPASLASWAYPRVHVDGFFNFNQPTDPMLTGWSFIVSSDVSAYTAMSTPAINSYEGTITPGTTAQYYRGDKTWATLDKASVGLGSVDNTSDAAKPISTATQTALNAKEGTITAGTTAQYYRGDKTWRDLSSDAVMLTGDQTIAGTKSFSSGILALTGPSGNRITTPTGGLSAPTFTTTSAGTRFVLYPFVTASSADLAIGVESNALWQSVGTSAMSFKWYAGTTVISTLSGAGALTATSFTGSGAGLTGLTKSQVGLANVDNTADTAKPVSTAQQTALNAKEGTITAGTTSQYWRGDKTWQALDSLPVSTATQTALDLKSNKTSTVNTQTGATYTLALSDADGFLVRTGTGVTTVTIPENATVALPVGTSIEVINLSTGVMTIAGTGAVTVVSSGASLNLATNKSATLVQRAADTWYAVGAFT